MSISYDQMLALTGASDADGDVILFDFEPAETGTVQIDGIPGLSDGQTLRMVPGTRSPTAAPSTPRAGPGSMSP